MCILGSTAPQTPTCAPCLERCLHQTHTPVESAQITSLCISSPCFSLFSVMKSQGSFWSVKGPDQVIKINQLFMMEANMVLNWQYRTHQAINEN